MWKQLLQVSFAKEYCREGLEIFAKDCHRESRMSHIESLKNDQIEICIMWSSLIVNMSSCAF